MRIAVTGHRPANLPGQYDEEQHASIKQWLRDSISEAFTQDENLEAACGMAIGVDIYFAEACEDLGVPFKAFIPFTGQENRWPRAMQRRYRSLLIRSMEIDEASPNYSTRAFFERNDRLLQWLTRDREQTLVCVWNGVNAGGTYYTMTRAKEIGIPIKVLEVGEP